MNGSTSTTMPTMAATTIPARSTFLNSVLMPIPANTTPNYDSLVTIQHELNENAHSIYSPHGGEFGLLALTLTPVKYIQLTGASF